MLNVKQTSKKVGKDVFTHLGSVGYLPRWTVLVIDMFICLAAIFIANVLAKDLYYYQYTVSFHSVSMTMFALLTLQTLWFWVFRTYSGVLRYTTYVDLMKIGASVFTNVLFVLLINTLVGYYAGETIFLKLMVIVYGFIAFLMIFVFRTVVRTVFQEIISSTGRRDKVMVYGAKSAGISIAKMLISDEDSKYYLSGFISDENSVPSQKILGKPIFSILNRDRLLREMKKRNVGVVIVSPTVMRVVNEDTLNWFVENGIKVMNLPVMRDWKEGGSIEGIDLASNLKKMQIEDLLGRMPIRLNDEHISNSVKNKVVLVTGSAGSIGSEIVRQLMRYEPKFVVLVDNAETPLHDIKLELGEKVKNVIFACVIADVRNLARVEQVMEEYRPDYVYHAAAYKHVPMMEDHPSECVLTNVMGTMNVALCAVKCGVKKFVMVSTDKAVNPTNVMGASKRIAEIYVQSLFKNNSTNSEVETKFITTRFGNVLGSNGSVIPLFRKQIEAGGPLTVTHPDIIRYFMTIPEACQLVLEASVMGEGGEIYVFDMGKPVRIVDLAKKMISMSGLMLNRDIKIEYTGLRPGEKLYEELLNTQEKTIKTQHEKIMIAKVREYDFDLVKQQVRELISLANDNKDYLIVEQMKNIVPEYKSKNSRFESLDAKTK